MKTSTRSSTTRTIIIFCAMVLVFAVLLIFAASAASAFASQVMLTTGCVIFGAGLTYFLLEITRLNE